MKRLYGELTMGWPSVLLFAAAAGIYTGAVMTVEALKDTSFQDIGISYEWWVIFAVIIVVNCRRSWDAMLKCFVFFLVSQPLVYATEILLGTLTLQKAWYYYGSIWLPMTFLTLPGGFIAFFCRKQSALGAVVLGLGNTIQAALGVHYFAQAILHFPHHLLSGIVCVASILLMSFGIQREKRNRLISVLTPLILTALIAVLCGMSGRTLVGWCAAGRAGAAR